ncbi:MAG: hypothetical protein ACOY93_18820 [Bacillota bacterium]
MSIANIILGAVAGLVVTLLVTYLWPPKRNRHVGAIVGALIGFAVAALLMTQVDL